MKRADISSEISFEGSISVSAHGNNDVSVAEVTCLIVRDGIDLVFKSTGASKRNPMDSPDPQLGRQIAIARALKSLSKAIQKDANKREAQLGNEAARIRRANSNKVKGGLLHPAKVKVKKPKKAVAKKVAV